MKIVKKVDTEEVNTKTVADATLPSSENVEELDGKDTSIPNLSNIVKPTELEKEEAGLVDAEAQEQEEVSTELEPNVLSEGDTVQGEQPMTQEQEAVETMLTQSQVNEIVGKVRTETRDKTLSSLFERYGVGNDGELDSLVGNSQRYDSLNDAYAEAQKALKEAQIKLAMSDSGIAAERYEDARLILQGKGLEVNAENIQAELATHPEWSKVKPEEKKVFEPEANKQTQVEKRFEKKTEPSSTIRRLGNDKSEAPNVAKSERESAMSLYGLK